MIQEDSVRVNVGDAEPISVNIGTSDSLYVQGSLETTERMIDTFSAPVYGVPGTYGLPGISYERLLEIARKMHLWIFNNTVDEEDAYREIGLTDAENEILRYMGKLVIKERGR